MRTEPAVKRVSAFIDGQNLFYAARDAYGYKYPNYDPQALARRVCADKSWSLHQTHFYTGIPDATIDPKRNHFWTAKMAVMGTRGVRVFSRPLRYKNEVVERSDGTSVSVLVGREKGIDVRIALDVVRLARSGTYDVALIFSQDQDLSEAMDEVKQIAYEQNRWLWLACAFPTSPTYVNKRGINGADWIRIPRDLYDACIDPHDYRLPRP